MARNKQKRRLEIIRALSDLSRDGWAAARFCDYAPLEKELRELSKPLVSPHPETAVSP